MIRSRRDGDLPACIALATAVHASDGYPPYLPDLDFERFLVSVDALATWVATVDDEVVGHVALHTRSSDRVMDLACSALTVTADRLAVIARLFVAPDRRRQGIGAQLLHVAVAEARGRGRSPVLDVWTGLPAAIAAYDRLRWRRLGSVTVDLPGAEPMEEVVFAAPAEET